MTLRGALGVRAITPPRPTPLSGFAVRAGMAQGTLDPLTVRGLLLEQGNARIFILSYDLIGVPDELEGFLRAALPDPKAELILCATHTHAGPPTLSRALLGEVDAEYLRWLAEQTADLIRELLDRPQEITLQHGKAPVEGVAVNRRIPDGPLDPFADVVQFFQAGKLSGLWVNYACHPVALGPDNLKYSADFPGEARRVLEEQCGVPVLYTTGCAGQINTGHRAEDSINLTGLAARTPEAMRAFGQRVATGVLRHLEQSESWVEGSDLTYTSEVLTIQFPEPPIPVQEVVQAAHTVLSTPDASVGARALAELDLQWAGRSSPTTLDLPVSVLQAGPLRAVFLPGEVFVETALRLQAAFPGLMVVAYAHSNPGYLPDDSAYSQGGYEVDVAYRPYGLRSPFPPGTLARLELIARQYLGAP